MTRFVLMALLCSGCAFFRPTQATIDVDFHASSGDSAELISDLSSPRSRECLLVLLPGIGDRGESFRSNGFVEDARDQGCDFALVDATFEYYLAQEAVPRVATDVLYEARRYGYQKIWLVGISLGGYGAVLTARAHPELVDGVVLIAPMLGLPPRVDTVVDEVIAAGGLHQWDNDTLSNYRHDFQEPRLVWTWLRDHAVIPRDERPLVLGFGAADRFAPRHEVLADALPSSSVFRAEGGHDWDTWRRLWQGIIAERPWEPATQTEPRIEVAAKAD
ncbi:MAG: alpha/beta hydrolase [Polyangiales bacterium]